MDKDMCINELENFDTQIQKILSLFDERGFILPDAFVNDAQEKLKALKQNLENEYKKRSTVKGKKNMTEVEKQYFLPAIHQTFAYLTIRVNSNPDEKWVMELKRAEQEIKYYLNALKRKS